MKTKPKKPAKRKSNAAIVVKFGEVAPSTETVLVMRTCRANMSAYGGFVWPKAGPVEAKDFSSLQVCGQGLHGLLWGEGDATLLNWDESAKWLVVEVAAHSIVDLAGKVKFPRGVVVFCGDSHGAAKLIASRAPATVTRIVSGTATAGYRGTATAGYSGTATAGYRGTATAGDRGTATAGHSGTATAGDRGTATAGDSGTATAGDSGTATAGDRGTATAGDRGTATAGDRGTATAGDSGTASISGDMGAIVSRWYDGSRWRMLVGIVGEDGLLPNTKYRAEAGKWVVVP